MRTLPHRSIVPSIRAALGADCISNGSHVSLGSDSIHLRDLAIDKMSQCTEKIEERTGRPIEIFDTAMRHFDIVPSGCGEIGRQRRREGLKAIWLPAPYAPGIRSISHTPNHANE